MALKIPVVFLWNSKEQIDCTSSVEIPYGGHIDFL
jgi:hypothetical protein